MQGGPSTLSKTSDDNHVDFVIVKNPFSTLDVDVFIQTKIVRFLHHSIAIGKLSFTFTKRNLIRVSIVKIVCQLEIHMKIGCSILRFFFCLCRRIESGLS